MSVYPCSWYRLSARGVGLTYMSFLLAILVYIFDIVSSMNRPFLPGYLFSLGTLERDRSLLCIWPVSTSPCSYLVLTPSPHSGEDLVNYKSMDGKTKKTPGQGQLPNDVPLNFLQGVWIVPAPMYLPYLKWELFWLLYACAMSHQFAPLASQ